MRKIRLVSLLLALTCVFGLTANLESQSTCIKSCEHVCLAREEACLAGSLYPECGGDSLCCYKKVASCYSCCTWY